MVSQDIDKNKGVESTNIQELKEKQMEKSQDEKSWEELIKQKQELEEEYKKRNKELILLKQFNRWKNLLSGWQRIIVNFFKENCIRNTMILLVSALLIFWVIYNDSSLFKFVTIFSVIFYYLFLVIVKFINYLDTRIEIVMKPWNKVKKEYQTLKREAESEELEEYIKMLEDKEIPHIRNKIDELAPNIKIKGDESLRNEWGKIKKFVKKHQTLMGFVLPIIFLIGASSAKLVALYSVVGKFHYWGINPDNTSIFGNGFDRYIIWGLAFFYFLICFLAMNKWRYENKEGIIDIEWRTFFFQYIPLMTTFMSIIVLPVIIRTNHKTVNLIVMGIFVFMSLIILYVSYKINSSKSTTKVIKFFIYVVLILFLSFSISKLFIGKYEFAFDEFFSTIELLMAVLSIYYMIITLIAVMAWLIVSMGMDVFFTKKDLLVRYSESKFRKPIIEKLILFFVFMSTVLFISYFSQALFPPNDEYTVVKVKLDYEDSIKEYVVLMEHNNQYYISDFETEDREGSVTLKIFNGKYHIISNENVEITKQESSEKIKTDMSRTEYYAQFKS